MAFSHEYMAKDGEAFSEHKKDYRLKITCIRVLRDIESIMDKHRFFFWKLTWDWWISRQKLCSR